MVHIALIPAYKPTEVLPDLVRQCRKNGLTVVVVDDGSGEEYTGVFTACGAEATVLRHGENEGKGRALKTGLAYIADRWGSETVVVTLDADGQHKIEDAVAVCAIADEHPEALVLGGRRFERKVPLRSRFGNAVTRFVYRVSTGYRVYDTQTGLRAFSGSMLSRLSGIPGERYEYEMNMLFTLAKDGVEILEHPIETIYAEDNAQSHFHAVWDSLRIYKEILKFSASSFLGFLVDYAVYSLLLLFTDVLWVANVIARIISATVNFTVNRRYVFDSRESVWKSAVKYVLLAAVILAGNTVVLNLLVNAGLHKLGAKLITELFFFIFSWLIQRLLVFRNRKGGN